MRQLSKGDQRSGKNPGVTWREAPRGEGVKQIRRIEGLLIPNAKEIEKH